MREVSGWSEIDFDMQRSLVCLVASLIWASLRLYVGSLFVQIRRVSDYAMYGAMLSSMLDWLNLLGPEFDWLVRFCISCLLTLQSLLVIRTGPNQERSSSRAVGDDRVVVMS